MERRGAKGMPELPFRLLLIKEEKKEIVDFRELWQGILTPKFEVNSLKSK